MPDHTRQSRFNPAYLASRHAGLIFACIAFGLCAGLAWRTLVQPTRYWAESDVFFSLAPESAAPTYDWESKTRSWKSLLANQQDQDLLGSNLRFLVKLSYTGTAEPDVNQFSAELARFEPAREFSTVLFPGRVSSLGHTIAITRRDVAANLDFQTLAAIIADLDAPSDIGSWDFSFFSEDFTPGLFDSMIVKTTPDDRYFRVFYHLYQTLQPSRTMVAPEEAWRAAVDEVADRLDREAQFPGGGGFGPMARRELVREFAAIPVLAANSLYHAFSWSHGDNDFRTQSMLWSWRWRDQVLVSAVMRDNISGTLGAGMSMDLFPLMFPRDTTATRIPPLVTATILAYIARMEAAPVQSQPEPAPTAAPQPEPIGELPVPPPPAEPEDMPAVTIVQVQPVEPEPESPPLPDGVTVDQETERLRRETILLAEAKIRQVHLQREAAIRHLAVLREREQSLVSDIWSAKDRVDRLAQRADELRLAMPQAEYSVSPEVARLTAERDRVREYLAELLQTCTGEHPFVRKARRELAAITLLLDELDPGSAAKRQMVEWETTLRNVRLEYEAARLAADNLEERRRRTGGEITNAVRAVESIEQNLIDLDRDLAKLQALPLITKSAEPVSAAPEPKMPAVEQTLAPEPEPLQLAEQQPVRNAPAAPAPVATGTRSDQAVIQFAALPQRIALYQEKPPWDIPLMGALAGLVFGLLATLVREVSARRFGTPREARRMVPLRLLAVLPAYDAKSFRAAAAGMKGEVFGKKEGGLNFIPAPVETAEPKPAVRRTKIAPAKRRMPLTGWIAGLVLLGLAAALYFAGLTLFRPDVYMPRELPCR